MAPPPLTFDDLPEMVPYAMAERFFGVKRSSILRMITDGDLDVVHVRPRAPRITKESIRRLLRRRG